MKCANCYDTVGDFLAYKDKVIKEQQAEITRLTALVESYKADAERYGWLKNNIDRFPSGYNAPHVRISENYDYAMSTDIDKQIDDAMKEKG
ncbi:MAG: hypothetical protein V4440_14760 [Pseudomonadota bacterium]